MRLPVVLFFCAILGLNVHHVLMFYCVPDGGICEVKQGIIGFITRACCSGCCKLHPNQTTGICNPEKLSPINCITGGGVCLINSDKPCCSGSCVIRPGLAVGYCNNVEERKTCVREGDACEMDSVRKCCTGSCIVQAGDRFGSCVSRK